MRYAQAKSLSWVDLGSLLGATELGQQVMHGTRRSKWFRHKWVIWGERGLDLR